MSSQYDSYKSQCGKALEHFKTELKRRRSGRAAPSILEGLQVDYYGSNVSLQQLGLVAAPEPRMLTIQVYDLLRRRFSSRIWDSILRVMGR